MRLRLGFLVALGLLGAFVACVGDDPQQPITTSPGTDAGTTPETSTTNPTNTGDSGGTDTTDSGATPECTAYCGQFAKICTFESTSTDSYPSSDACLQICGLMQVDGVTLDSVACRTPYLDASTPDCVAAGPWGADFDTQKICGPNQPCDALCRAMSPKCAPSGTIGVCTDTCGGNLNGGNPSAARTCMYKATLDAYSTTNPTDIATLCSAFKGCVDAQ